MGSGLVPVIVALSDADQASIPHVDGDYQPFTFPCGNSAFPKYHMFCINIIMDGRKLADHMKPHSCHQFVHHGLPVVYRKLLYQLHVMDVLLKQRAFHVGQLSGDCGAHPVF